MAMYETNAVAKVSETGSFEKIKIQRNEAGEDDVQVDVKYCGICHTDVHVAKNEWKAMLPTNYPCVPGHELAGVVAKIGKNVKNIKVGQRVGIGCIVDACLQCSGCNEGLENYCEKGFTWTYNSLLKHGRIRTDKGYSLGGYSSSITVNQRFIVTIPDGYPMEKAGPIFCAAITTYSPLIHWGAKQGGKKVGVIGIGGLGQMAIKQAKAMGNAVTAISTSPRKESVAREIGASEFVISTDEESMKAASNSLDLILDTVAANHQVRAYLPLLKHSGHIVILGASIEPHAVNAFELLLFRKSVSGSGIGGMRETQECMEFCHEHGIYCDTELVTMDRLAEVYEKLSSKNDSITRYVLDVTKSLG